jgi:hypothetical protein
MEILDLANRDERVEAFDEIVRPHQADFTYHNEAHGIETSEDTVPQVEWCQKSGIWIRKNPPFFGMRGHDLGIGEDFREYGFDIPEEYAAHITAKAMRLLGFDEEQEIQPAREIIIVTNPSKTPRTAAHVIARRADIGNIGRAFVPFVVKSAHLWQEDMIRSQDRIGYKDWGQKSCGFLVNTVLAPDLSIPDYEKADPNAFSKKQALDNVEKLGGMLTRVADILESVPGPIDGAPLPDYAQLLIDNGVD